MASKYKKQGKLKDILWFIYDLAISLAFVSFILYLGKLVLFDFR